MESTEKNVERGPSEAFGHITTIPCSLGGGSGNAIVVRRLTLAIRFNIADAM